MAHGRRARCRLRGRYDCRHKCRGATHCRIRLRPGLDADGRARKSNHQCHPYGGNANGTTTRPSAYYNGLNQQSEARGTGGGQDQLVYLERQFNADFMANRAIQFIDDSHAANPNKPFLLNYWPDEVHTVNDPPAVYKAKYDALYPSLPADQRNYLASLEHVDAQIGRVVDHIDQLGLGNNTLILVTADNGAVARECQQDRLEWTVSRRERRCVRRRSS